jgi:hypothetical protein
MLESDIFSHLSRQDLPFSQSLTFFHYFFYCIDYRDCYDRLDQFTNFVLFGYVVYILDIGYLVYTANKF